MWDYLKLNLPMQEASVIHDPSQQASMHCATAIAHLKLSSTHTIDNVHVGAMSIKLFKKKDFKIGLIRLRYEGSDCMI